MKLILKKPYTVWIDADACPKSVKELLFKTSARLNIELILVANAYQSIPQSPLIKLIIVGKGQDVADQYIVEHLKSGDLVITADIPLAALVVEKAAYALNPRGEIYTEDNIDLRDSGEMTGGPTGFTPKDLEHFANLINQLFR